MFIVDVKSTEMGRPSPGPEAAWSPDIPNRLARHIVWFRDLRGFTQEALARRAGVSTSAIVDAESGQSVMTLRTLVLIAAALETIPGVLLGCVPPSPEVLEAAAARAQFS